MHYVLTFCVFAGIWLPALLKTLYFISDSLGAGVALLLMEQHGEKMK